MIINIILAVLMISVIIIAHEFGHFIVAKANGVTVVEFSLGFGPKLIHFKKGETEYCVKLIPFGGACIMLGDDMYADNDDDVKEDYTEAESMESAYDEGANVQQELRKKLENGYDMTKSFANKSIWSRIAIIAAGPIFNFILAFIFAVIIIGSVGADPCIVDVVEENSPAAQAGLHTDDEIIKVNSNNISFSKEFSFHQYYHQGETMNIVYKRDGQKYKTTVVPEYKKVQNYRIGVVVSNNTLITEVSENSPAQAAGLKANDIIVSVNGQSMSDDLNITDVIKAVNGAAIDIVINRGGENLTYNVTPALVETEGWYTGFDSYGYRVKTSPAATIGYAFKEVGYWIEAVIKSVGMMFTGQLGVNDLSGPVGIVDSVNSVVEESKPDGAWYVMLNLFNYMVMISANLGVMNLLPLPALDGGRLLFMLIELVRGKPVKKEREGMVHFVGMVLLMILMVYVLFKDIKGLF